MSDKEKTLLSKEKSNIKVKKSPPLQFIDSEKITKKKKTYLIESDLMQPVNNYFDCVEFVTWKRRKKTLESPERLNLTSWWNELSLRASHRLLLSLSRISTSRRIASSTTRSKIFWTFSPFSLSSAANFSTRVKFDRVVRVMSAPIHIKARPVMEMHFN